MSDTQAFINKMLPYAQKAAAATNRDPGVILAQWAVESGWGSSSLATKGNNYGGIRYVGQNGAAEIKTGSNGSFAAYQSVDGFVNDFIRVMNLGRYAGVRNATNPTDEIKALSGSGYDAGGYGGGGIIAQVYNQYMKGVGMAGVGKPQPERHCQCRACGYLCKGGKPPVK